MKKTEVKPKEEPTKKRRRGVRLNSLGDIKRLLNRSINEVLNGQMNNDTLRAVSFSCQCLIKIHELSDVEKRITSLEAKVNNAK